MKKIMIVLMFLFVSSGLGVVFGASPMVEKHIFLPQKAPEKKVNVSDDKLKKGLIFTGVIVSDKGRYAFAKTKTRKKGVEQKKIYKEGDEILGAVISKINANNIVLLNEGKEVKIRLFSGSKKRPAPVSAIRDDAIQQAQAQQKASSDAAAKKQSNKKAVATGTAATATSGSGQKKVPTGGQASTDRSQQSGAKKSNPFAEALKRAMQNKKQASGQSTTTNPFLEAIKKAQQK